MPRLSLKLELSSSAVSSSITDGLVQVNDIAVNAFKESIFFLDSGNGESIWFSLDKYGGTPLNSKVTHWSKANNRFSFDVKIPILSAVLGATFYFHVGGKPSSYIENPYRTNLLDYRPLFENLNDLSPNSNSATQLGSMTFGSVTGPNGILPATSGDGSNDVIQIAGGSDALGEGDITISLWFYASSYPSGIEFLWEAGGGNYNASIHIESNGNVYGVRTANTSTQSVSQSYSLNTWNHVSLNIDNGTLMQLYFNGSMASSISLTESGDYGGSTVSIFALEKKGRSRSGSLISNSTGVSSNFFDGNISQVYAYKESLSSQETFLNYVLQGSNASSYWTCTREHLHESGIFTRLNNDSTYLASVRSSF